MHLLLLALYAPLAAASPLASIDGLWHAAVKLPAGELVPFQVELASGGSAGALVNGNERIRSNKGSFDGSRLRLEFWDWDGVLEARLDNGRWTGAFTRQRRKEKLTRPLEAQRAPILKPMRPPAIDASGDWILQVDKAVWRATFRQKGAQIEGTLIPVTGDYGLLTGFVDGDTLRLSRFDGIRTELVEARLAGGVMTGRIDAALAFTARRTAEASARPDDAAALTRMKNPAESFRFSFPDLDGKPVSEAAFRGKALIVSIMGSWCPNCHDEVELLKELWNRYHAQGLEIVSVAFEYTGDTARDVRQIRRFVARHGIPWTVLYAGSTEEAESKLAQLENFRAYPTSLYVGRDGIVRATHAGFDGPSTGAAHRQLRQHITHMVAALLR